MNHLKTGTAYFAQGSYKSYKYNGKELQETGMYDYGWRHYMPDLGRWNAMDMLSEYYQSGSPYAYVMNNPVMFIDPDGRLSQIAISEIINSPGGTTWTNNGSGFSNNWGGSMDYDGNPGNYGGYANMASGGRDKDIAGTIDIPGVVLSGSSSGWGSQIQSQFNSYMNNLNNNWGANVAMGVTGVMSLPTGGGASAGTWTAIRGVLGELAGGLRAGLWSLPLLLEGDTSRREQMITLYRGVHKGHPDYGNALKGMAVPRGGSATPTEHNEGDNNSIYTSWSIYESVADKFGGRKGIGGVVLIKTFDVRQIIPSPDKFQQGEVLVPGVVSGAIVIPATPNPKKIR